MKAADAMPRNELWGQGGAMVLVLEVAVVGAGGAARLKCFLRHRRLPPAACHQPPCYGRLSQNNEWETVHACSACIREYSGEEVQRMVR